jgi:ectoine hydroxylase-related dioxygenase (phytanoyl-CoA dioxygenase family)
MQKTSVVCTGVQAVKLTVEQVRSYADNGHLSVDGIAPPEEILEMRAIIQNLFEDRIGEKEGAYAELIAGTEQPEEANSPQILSVVNYAPRLHQTQCFRSVLAIAKQLLGDDARFFLDLSIMKAARVGQATPWHQDAAFRDPRFDYNELAIWVPLQDVTAESGCLQFVSGSHNKPLLEHHSMNDDSSSQALECIGSFDKSAARAYPLSMGSCSIHHPGTLHCSSPNLSDKPRYAYIMVFSTVPKPAMVPKTFPWLENRETAAHVRKRQWMRHGGMFIAVWRRLRRGDLSSWHSLVYWVKRSVRTVAKGE